MDLDTLRPVASGVIGSLVSLWLMRRWASHIPNEYQGKSAEQLIADYRGRVVAANATFFSIVILGAYLFKAGHVPSTSWTHFGLLIGTAVLATVAVMLLPTIGKQRSCVVEAVIAFSIAERTPLPVLGAIVVFGVACFAGGLGGLLGS